MKKLLLSVVFAMVALTTTFAAQLNPFAYGLYVTEDASTGYPRLHFRLNATAKKIRIYVSDGVNEYLLRNYDDGNDRPAGGYATSLTAQDVENLNLPVGKDLSWRVEVDGVSPNAPVRVTDHEYSLYHPSSIDIDNNPENVNFGTIYCVEGLNNLHTSKNPDEKYKNYLSYGDGAGLYVFNAAFEHQPKSNSVNVYNNGIDFTKYDYKIGSNTAYAPRRVRVSNDGRVFISTQELIGADNTVLWEVKGLENNWTTVMSGSLTDYNANTEASGFYAAPNVALDTRGEGSDLELAMLSGTLSAWGFDASHYRLSTYMLGHKANNPTLNRSPYIDYLDKPDGTIIIAYDASQIEFDNAGGIWVCQGRSAVESGKKQPPSLIHYNANRIPDLVERRANRSGGAFRFNKDCSRVIASGEYVGTISGVTSNNTDGGCTVAKATIYSVSYNANGVPTLTASSNDVIDMSYITNNTIADFAWDYADNVYATSVNKEKVVAWALPYSGTRSTPASSRETFQIACTQGEYYAVSISCNPERGSVTMNAEGMVDGKVPSCSNVTVVAIAKDNYEFVCWKKGETVVSNNASYTFLAVEDNIHLTAHFEGIDCSVTWWNLFENGEDIAKESEDYPDRNERLWRLFQVEYNDYQANYQNESSQYDAGVNTAKQQFKVLAFFLPGNNKAYNNNSSNPDPTGHEMWNMCETFLNDGDEYDGVFGWLGKYIESCSIKNEIETSLSPGYNTWGWFLQAFINRQSVFYDMDMNNSYDNLINGRYPAKDFSTYGKPEYWRPWWTESICQLPKMLHYGDQLPVSWSVNRTCPSGGTSYFDKNYESTKLPPKDMTPSDWLVWNKVTSIPNGHDDTHILAWRNGSVEGDIVHHVTQDGMKLYATYVNKTIDENDENGGPAQYDASNEDVIKLMQNPNFGVGATHILQVRRNLQAGMYNTICLPFDVDLNGLMDSHPLKEASLLEFTGVTSLYNESGAPVTVLNFTEVAEEVIGNVTCRILKRGKPYLIKMKGSSDVADLLHFSGIGNDRLILTPNSSESINGVTFHATINPTTIPAGSLILVADNRLALTTETGQMLGLRGYFTIDPMMASDIAEQAKEGRVYLSMKKPVTTSIPVAPEAEQQTKPQVRKIMYDGQIYILRDNEVYTITGTRVK